MAASLISRGSERQPRAGPECLSSETAAGRPGANQTPPSVWGEGFALTVSIQTLFASAFCFKCG